MTSRLTGVNTPVWNGARHDRGIARPGDRIQTRDNSRPFPLGMLTPPDLLCRNRGSILRPAFMIEIERLPAFLPRSWQKDLLGIEGRAASTVDRAYGRQEHSISGGSEPPGGIRDRSSVAGNARSDRGAYTPGFLLLRAARRAGRSDVRFHRWESSTSLAAARRAANSSSDAHGMDPTARYRSSWSDRKSAGGWTADQPSFRSWREACF